MKIGTTNVNFILPFIICLYISHAQSTCVLESDFGFSLNCNFKKSGLFRVRNLGGVKAHFGLGLSVGDELGFAESLGNLEGNKRRSLNLKTGSNDLGVYPTINMPTVPTTLVKRVNQPNIPQYGIAPTFAKIPEIKPPRMTQASSLPLGVPAFRPIPKIEQDENYKTMLRQALNIRQKSTAAIPGVKNQTLERLQSLMHQESLDNIETTKMHIVSAIPTVPNSISRISNGNTEFGDRIGIESMISPYAHEFRVAQKKDISRRNSNELAGPAVVDLKGHTVEELALAANVTVDAIKSAIAERQKVLDQEYYAMKGEMDQQKTLYNNNNNETPDLYYQIPIEYTQSTSQPTTEVIVKKVHKKYHTSEAKVHKVMNAPKEYYPVGYEKNFDDNFTARVDLPSTPFHCGEQKHFPGLYADDNLGCMVFHVCAITDNGLIMKSFLCPESTLFDQSILRCNWWFYVECKNSQNLYDSNLPVSKSYQLMKSLSYFSKYKNQPDNETLKNIVLPSQKELIN